MDTWGRKGYGWLSPEIALYFRRVLDHTLDTDHRYLREVSSDRVHIQPRDRIGHTEIENRIEKQPRTLLLNNTTAEIKEQSAYRSDISTAQILYRAMTQAGPAGRAD